MKRLAVSFAAVLIGMIMTGMIAGYAESADAEKLAKQKGCTQCHDVNAKRIGPAYKDVAKKYAGQKDALDKLVAKVKKGGKGVWGQVAMPPQRVTDEEVKQLVEWVLSLK